MEDFNMTLWFLDKCLVIRQNYPLIRDRTRQNKMRKVRTKVRIMQILERSVMDTITVFFSSFFYLLTWVMSTLIHSQWSWPHDKEVSDTVWKVTDALRLNYSNYCYKLEVSVFHGQPPFSSGDRGKHNCLNYKQYSSFKYKPQYIY